MKAGREHLPSLRNGLYVWPGAVERNARVGLRRYTVFKCLDLRGKLRIHEIGGNIVLHPSETPPEGDRVDRSDRNRQDGQAGNDAGAERGVTKAMTQVREVHT